MRRLARNLVYAVCTIQCATVGIIAEPLPPTTPEGYSIPQPGRQFNFPRDHGSHPDFAIEWWYVTGHLIGQNSRRLGFQATFFRRAVGRRAPTQEGRPSTIDFGNQEIFLAHMALIDVQSGRFYEQEKINRGGWDAGASEETLNVYNGNWHLRRLTPAPANPSPETFELSGGIEAKVSMEFHLTPVKPLVVFGQDGVSRKAIDRTAASHYLTFPRLRVSGTVRLDNAAEAVTGEAWMDHEFSSSQLGEGQAGWDWASIQLKDGRELMTYRMRRKDGSTDPFSSLSWVDKEGRVQSVGPDGFSWKFETTWRSPNTGINYPAIVRLTTKDPNNDRVRTFVLKPLAANQELPGHITRIPYWEGACDVTDDAGRDIGNSYLELTGYGPTLNGKF